MVRADTISALPKTRPVKLRLTTTLNKMKGYWNKRYEAGTTFAGSTGRLLDFKFGTVQGIVNEYGIKSVVDLGCGFPAVLAALDVDKYMGVEISDYALSELEEHASDTKAFKDLDDLKKADAADMAVSLDVIQFVPDDEFHAHLDLLFTMGKKYVLIYAPNQPGTGLTLAEHMYFREFLPYVKEKYGKEPAKIISNDYPADYRNQRGTSFSSFYLFENAAHRNTTRKKKYTV